MNPSASKISDMMACAYPFRPDVELAPDETGPAGLIGHAIDSLVSAHVAGTDLTPQGAAAAHHADEREVVSRAVHLLPWLEENIHRSALWAAQLWLVWNARTDRAIVVSRDEGRRRKRQPLDLSSIADLAAQTGPDEATVYDVKSGKVSGARPEQLITIAVAARRWYGVSKVRTGFVFAHTDGVHVERFDFSPDDMDEHATRLETYLLEVPTARPTPGTACRFCRVVHCEPGDAHRRKMRWTRKQ